jgi:hypothetical protein
MDFDSHHLAKIMKRAKKTKAHVPKPGRSLQVLTSKGSPVSLSSETDSSDDDTDSSYDSDSSPPPEKSPLPTSRPQKAVEAVRYDTIKAVWFPRNKFAENIRILKGLADLWEVVRTIRDRWKADRDAVKKAIESKHDSELPLLRERVDKQLEMMEAVLIAAVEFGHPDLLSAYVLPLSPFFHSSAFVDVRIRDVRGSARATMSTYECYCRNVVQRKAICSAALEVFQSSSIKLYCSLFTSMSTDRHRPKMFILRLAKTCRYPNPRASNLSFLACAIKPKLTFVLRCGQNAALMLVCYTFILEPIREGKYTGSFIKAMFKVREPTTTFCRDVILTVHSSCRGAPISTVRLRRSQV